VLPASPRPTRLPAWDRYSPSGLASARNCRCDLCRLVLSSRNKCLKRTRRFIIAVRNMTEVDIYDYTWSTTGPVKEGFSTSQYNMLHAQVRTFILCKSKPFKAPFATVLANAASLIHHPPSHLCNRGSDAPLARSPSSAMHFQLLSSGNTALFGICYSSIHHGVLSSGEARRSVREPVS
jgi:hypothetical protein